MWTCELHQFYSTDQVTSVNNISATIIKTHSNLIWQNVLTESIFKFWQREIRIVSTKITARTSTYVSYWWFKVPWLCVTVVSVVDTLLAPVRDWPGLSMVSFTGIITTLCTLLNVVFSTHVELLPYICVVLLLAKLLLSLGVTWGTESLGLLAMLSLLCFASWYCRSTKLCFGDAFLETPLRSCCSSSSLSRLSKPWLTSFSLQITVKYD